MGFPEPGASGRAAARGALLLAALVLWLPAAAQAQAPAEVRLVSNTGQTHSEIDQSIVISTNRDAAQGFRTGMASGGYVLSALELLLRSENSATMSDLTVTLRNASGGNPGSMVLATFIHPDSPALSATRQTFRFTLSEGVELDPETRYFIHFNTATSNSTEMTFTVSDNQDSGGLDDWGIDDSGKELRSNGWADVTNGYAILMRLNGYAKPPALSAAEVNGAELVLTYDVALDATSVPAATAFTVTVEGAAVSVSSVSVSGMAVTLGLATAVLARRTVLLDYVVPSSNPLQNGSGLDAAALAGEAVENRTPAPVPTGGTLVSNTGQPQNLIADSPRDFAQAFMTGMAPDGYVLSALELLMKRAGSATMSDLTVTLRNVSGGNPGSRVLATFIHPDSPALSTTVQTFRFTLSEGVELDRDTKYFIHLNFGTSNNTDVSFTLSNNQDSGGLADWGIDDALKQLGLGWADATPPYAIQILLDGYAKPSVPVLSTAEVNGAELVLTYDGALDATSVPAATAFTVTVEGAAVSVSTVSVSGMEVTLGLAEAVLASRRVRLDYVVPSSNPLRNRFALAAGALPGQAVENRTPVPGPQGPPVPDDRILVSNTGQSTSPVLFFRNQNYGQEFRTGMSPDGYVLSALELLLRTISSATMSNLTVTLRNVSGDNPGSMVLATFVNPDSPALSDTTQTFRFTLSEGVELDPETSYFIHLANNHASGSIHTGVTASDNQDSGGLEDWGIDDRARLFSSGSWDDLIIGSARTTFVVNIRLDGYAGAEVPPPVLSTAEVNGDELVLFYGEGLDATSVPAAAAFTVTAGGAAVSVSTVSVSGLRVTLGLASVVTAGQAVRLDYAVPSSNPLQGGSGSDAGALVGQVVENQTPMSVGRSLVSNTGQDRFRLDKL